MRVVGASGRPGLDRYPLLVRAAYAERLAGSRGGIARAGGAWVLLGGHAGA